MKDQVIMGPNAELAIAVPLFRMNYSDDLGSLPGYSIMLSNNKPMAYVLDTGHGSTCPIVNSTLVEKQCEFLSDLDRPDEIKSGDSLTNTKRGDE